MNLRLNIIYVYIVLEMTNSPEKSKSFSFRMIGSIRVHGIPKPTDEIYKSIAKISVFSLLNEVEKPVNAEIIGALVLSLFKALTKNAHLIKDGMSELGCLYSLYADFDKKGFSSIELETPLEKPIDIRRKLQANVVSSDRFHQIRYVVDSKIMVLAFNLSYWDEANDKGYQSIIPPKKEWITSIADLSGLNNAIKNKMSKGTTRDQTPGILRGEDDESPKAGTRKFSLLNMMKRQ